MEQENNYPFKVQLSEEYPPEISFQEGIRRAPSRSVELSVTEKKQALKNALRYIPKSLHKKIAPEFMEELETFGRIYGYRFRPTGEIKAKPLDEYIGIQEARAIQLMIDNNLDFQVALYPYELVTYGESGQVFQNWMQFQLTKNYLQIMTETQTLVMSSGHPIGLFSTHRNAPRVIATNGLMVGIFDTLDDFQRAASLGVTNYGQMTAGGWMYIGPQGIVHGTYITLLNAGRKYLGIPDTSDLRGKVFLTSGLGGMSGAQPKAADIAGAISITAEVDISRINTRFEQGWIQRVSDDLEEIFKWVDEYRIKEESLSIAYHGNIVDIWQYVVDNSIKIELASDQTSCHAVYEGGYTPVGISYEEGRVLLSKDREKFNMSVNASLRRQFELIKLMVKRGTFFWDYGNSFMKAVFDAGVKEISKNGTDTNEGFIFPSYVEDIMGPICFDYGYGPFRWVCLSGKDEDLRKTDKAAMSCINPEKRGQDRDNYVWIENAEKNKLVVGSKARILYADGEGRVKIALKFNEMIRNNLIGPVMIGRDHHDTGGTDSPFRETANIYDGSNITSDMSHHSWAGNVSRGMTMCVLSNGGGVGTGKAINGGFGIVLDGSQRIDQIIRSSLDWDVMSGVSRRSWARNEPSMEVVNDWNQRNSDQGFVTIPSDLDNDLIDDLIDKS
ncbi:MAG: urocanate hydratase [Candidatus Kariarchaeaceae archaeon]|jgi:urocanate hydratase